MRAQPPPSPWPSGTPRLRVGDVLVDLRYRQVRHGETVTELPQRMFDLLQLFLAEPHALHTRAELFERVWGDLVVEDANLSQSVWMLRKALGPERKDWIRTVAKSGYVFAPPAPVEALPEDDATATSPPNETFAPPASAANARKPPRRWRIAAWSAAAALAVVAASWATIAMRDKQHEAIVANAPQTTIALLEVHDRAAPGVNWPADLAHAWLAWKLRSLPEVTLLGESDLAADTGRISPTVVMLSCASGGPGEVVLRARFDDRRQSPIEVRGPVAQVPRLADDLSRQALARLVPRRATEQWPELVLDVAAARDYARAQDALERRDWSGSLPILRKVVRQAPRFGLAQLDLARAESSLGQAGPAVAAMNAARLNLRPLPADAQRLLDARALAVDPQRNNEAAAAYAALARSWPQRYDILLDHAGYLADAGKPEEARAILQRPEWAQRRTSQRIARLLALAHVDAALGDLQGSKAHASQALAMARAAGEGWANERGAALVLLAQLDSALHSTHPDNPLYEQAAREFDASGATADALYARVQRELVRPPGQGKSTRGVDILLAKAHAEGYRRLEIELLRSVAYQHYQAGQLAAYRDLMEQALAAADNAGDVQQQQFF
ncbi:MAG TPA: winged helix-turn-helix domain-containing protein, partial [Lysobacter sp.]|nr:winged helix-turn-helix domain-containing protein [Lysobacter sp.]